MTTLIINSSNVVQGSNNSIYKYVFSGGGISLDNGDEVAIQSICIPYSWFNISSFYNNNSFGYSINGNNFNINIPDGFYTITDLNNILTNAQITNGHYLLDSSGNYNVYLQIQLNISKYANEIDAKPFLSGGISGNVVPTGYTNPANVLYNTILINSASIVPQFVVYSNNNFGSIIGFTSGSYPTNSNYSSLQSITSNTVPNATPVNSLILRCNLIDNKHSAVPDVLFSFTPNNTSFGSNIVVNSSSLSWINSRAGNFMDLTITITDQNFQRIYMNDYNIMIQLLIRKKQK